ncbi:MAG: hypothetical protein F7C81_03785 [Desulfurococcales archaeon]|nr:hypothetical protein [Desulfurococcales archaeon]
MPRVLVIISSDNVGKALTGLMWAVNAVRYGWVDDVEVVFFGPVERLIAEGNEDILNAVMELGRVKKQPIACRRIAEKEGYLERLEERVKTEYVGQRISKLIAEGYTPLVF